MPEAKRVSDRQKNIDIQDGQASRTAANRPMGTLPNDVLLEIFKFYLDESLRYYQYAWLPLSEVCQRWRHVIAASPRYLGLQIICTTTSTSRPARDLISEWPALPITILHNPDPGREHAPPSTPKVEGVDNIIAALEHNNRVVDITLSDVPSWQLERFVAAMQKPFPELTSLDISTAYRYLCHRTPLPVFPDSFLGGSAPCLQSLRLCGIPFPGLLKLLLSFHDLVQVDIDLWDVNFTPEEMATYLSPMRHLESLKLKLYAMYSPPLAAGQHPPSLTRIVLPTLTSLQFCCTSAFLEDLLSRLDAPSLEKMEIKFFRLGPVSNISELPRFISRVETFETFDKADIHFHVENIQFVFASQTSSVASAEFSLTFKPILSYGLPVDPALVVCSFLPPLSRFKRLTLRENRFHYPGDLGSIPLEEILYSFTAVTNIFISKFMAASVSRCMEGLPEERIAAMLPALRNIFVGELQRQGERIHGAIQKFIAAKGLAGHPVTLYLWEVDG